MALCDFFQENNLILILLLWYDALKIQCKCLFNNSQNTSLKHWIVRITDLQMNKQNTSERTDLNSHTEWGAKLRIKQWISEKRLEYFLRSIAMGQYSFHSNHVGTLRLEIHILFFSPYNTVLAKKKKKKKRLFLLTRKLTSHQFSLVRRTNVDVSQVWSSVQVMAAEVFQLYFNYQGLAIIFLCQRFFATCFLASYCHHKFS